MLRDLDAVQVRCESFNGQEVHNLATFAELVDGCSDKYMKFGLEGGKSVILDRLQANEDAPRILQQHAITFDRSADLRCASRLGLHEAYMVCLPLIDVQILGVLLVP